ncbi:phosphoenolpyruvate carboxykinase [Salpingoeca rosetta]|uniref:phosphoenolpyruvate carboxykinase (ATP) n=1 Tax=Salpingoeca rosetta (strain ATCC 50818 / BSB-021) TaxID=946362 RepID=F2U4L5_SALR5|nr:phosphoenolpyruvate carboxykinase [Salpingoeca rosetta]EGD82581.1 phosphoenolpyruvate carboxykinase [Salpingoeca rosetta]|eukprot:XP_004995817.1 phosphoenolpyruvate carboxykinase [Salpingoeca rosetta]
MPPVLEPLGPVHAAYRDTQKDAPYETSAVSDCSVNPSNHTLDNHGIGNVHQEHWNLPTAALYEHAVHRGEGHIVHLGPLCVRTGKHTGRAAGDKYFVREPTSEKNIAWGDVNQEMSEEAFNWLHRKCIAYLQNRTVYVMDVLAGHDPKTQMPVRIVTETAWHALFARTMFVRPTDEALKTHVPKFTVIHCPGLKADPAHDGTKSSTFISLHMGKGLAVIGGTHYAGEMKKCIFTVMNYYLPLKGIMTMHAAANVGDDDRTAIFFGLSGTGKTTLSADESRKLIGDDEHIWSDEGVANIEGGCYAKVIRLSAQAEPTIWHTTRQFGTVLENVIMHPVTRTLDLSDNSITENTRAAYPLQFVPNRQASGCGGHPANVIMLTCDAFGVLPPISRLTPAQAEYWFLLGYTAKVAGTELGVTKPTATFSACFGLPFMPLHPTVYAKLLREKMEKHNVSVWLLNTGWSGGPYGVGERFSIKHTRSMLAAALDDKLQDVPLKKHETFNLNMPTSCPGVPEDVLDPRNTWSDAAAYEKQANELAALCVEGFKPFVDAVTPDVLETAPRA